MESIDNERKEKTCVRILCSRKMLFRKEPCLQWLIGSPAFFPPFTILSSFRCLHFQTQGDPFSPDYVREADDLKTLLLRGFDIIGVLFINNSINWEENACMAAESSHRMRKLFYGIQGHNDMIGAAADLVTGDIRFFVSRPGKSTNLEAVGTTIYEENPERFLWDIGCLLRCEMTIKLPIYVPTDKVSEAEERFCSAVDAAAAKLKGPNVSYMVEAAHVTPEEVFKPIVFHYNALDFETDLLEVKLLTNFATESDAETVLCSDFCLKNRPFLAFTSGENADAIQVTVLFNQSGNSSNSFAPIAEYFPASGPAQLLFGSFKLDVLSYASKGLPLASAVSKLIVPGLADQLTAMKKAFLPNLLTQHTQLRSYHFNPPGVLHPITALYELSYGETEMKKVQLRRSIHLRLGLPLDRPLLLIANALTFGVEKGNLGKSSRRNGSDLLKDIHTEVPSSGVSGGLTSLVQGSYEYYHYLHDGFDDSGWGCAYRSLQTIISWFRLEHYTSIDVPSHRDIQQALVDIGDKEPSFLGSREWIGAIELSFVLDKLLGVSCKVINVRSGAELPEKCRELALHFEMQGTPVMIGGGVLAYTLLGVDYNEASGDCAFLILDPHYTGNDDLKKIVNGGWCGWKKAIDSKGRNFFLHDKFYNLLLPQRPNMV